MKRSAQSHTAGKGQSLGWNSDPLTPRPVGLPNACRICWHLRDVNRLACLGIFASTVLFQSPVFSPGIHSLRVRHYLQQNPNERQNVGMRVYGFPKSFTHGNVLKGVSMIFMPCCGGRICQRYKHYRISLQLLDLSLFCLSELQREVLCGPLFFGQLDYLFHGYAFTVSTSCLCSSTSVCFTCHTPPLYFEYDDSAL